jgi:hypothetical protein
MGIFAGSHTLVQRGLAKRMPGPPGADQDVGDDDYWGHTSGALMLTNDRG